ncbi:zinc finger domain-containing protein [Pedobacter sp. AW31-3R]|uniref:zinc finger domain-containing protein n=1 Tax=Pedobacter sp. AW31-3R TaxID=3445781 RepID=UPI003F9EBED4
MSTLGEANGTTGVCKGCGAHLNYTPGKSQVKCEYCGVQNEIVVNRENVNRAADPFSILKEHLSIDTSGYKSIKCQKCQSNVSIHPDTKAATCPLCATPLNIGSSSTGNRIRASSGKLSDVDQAKVERQAEQLKRGCLQFFKYLFIIIGGIFVFILLVAYFMSKSEG